ncbi:hypothetical protein GGQ99_005216 [Aminobacter niigataensis]|uniref:Transposase n=1 Tax=Aminobacter niigataensis TaxID=83265 RepID=A0ABR6L9M3_9HYPH|nr:hypothetical protein [Aminobacter niigataensis]
MVGIAALLNRERRSQDLPPVNRKKLLLRIMQANGLVLTSHTAYRRARTHDGVVSALRSNIRWCSDHLELKCRNGDIVRVLFGIDACDREIVAYCRGPWCVLSFRQARNSALEATTPDDWRTGCWNGRQRGCPSRLQPSKKRTWPDNLYKRFTDLGVAYVSQAIALLRIGNSESCGDGFRDERTASHLPRMLLP